MTRLPLNGATAALARRIIWFEAPDKALEDPVRFLAYAFAHATFEDICMLETYLSEGDFREALDHAPPGIIDPRSWAYWTSKFGRYPAPPMPTRTFGSPPSGENG